MGIFEIILVGLGLAMDVFAVSICKGLSMKKMDWKSALTIALYFVMFHILMPVIGYSLGTVFRGFVESIDHWITFNLLVIIGANMIKESVGDEEDNNDKVDVKNMLLLSLATSIDALAVGITFAFFKTNLLLIVSIIGLITFVLSITGVKIGNRFGDKLQNKAEITGGIVLIIIAIKILLEHLGIVVF